MASSSGTYFPPPVRAVAIPKKSGGERILGVPTVADRVAQMVVKLVIEPILDPIFLADSYGYRPNKSALDAIKLGHCDLPLRVLLQHTGAQEPSGDLQDSEIARFFVVVPDPAESPLAFLTERPIG